MVTIRTAVPKDADRINDLFREMLITVYGLQDPEGYTQETLDRFFSGEEGRIYVAEDRDVVAFLSIEVHHDPRDYLYLDDFSVTETYRNRGIGSELLRTAEAYAKEIGIPDILLHVEKSNFSAFRFYEKWGYAVFRDDETRYLMIKHLWQA
ncbi:MAG: GNAT family N-acetyltransferase [Clostridia bacterium]|nr:GNAT family N-acetyltransferase [Clostridia bacterium]